MLPALAQPRGAPARRQIGVLAVEPDEMLRQSLRELGLADGPALAIRMPSTEGRVDRLAALTDELVRDRVDVIVAAYPAAALAASRATASIPIVMMNTPDPTELGLVRSLARPGGNVTGVTTLSVELSLKQLELLKEAVPRASPVALLWNPDNPWHPVTVRGLRARSAELGLALQVLPIRSPADFAPAFDAMTTQRSHAVLLLADPMTFVHRERLAGLAIDHRLPMMGSLREYADAGSLLSYWADRAELSRRTASYVARILKGNRPEELPVEQPTKYELVVNLATARTLELMIPESILLRADQVLH